MLMTITCGRNALHWGVKSVLQSIKTSWTDHLGNNRQQTNALYSQYFHLIFIFMRGRVRYIYILIILGGNFIDGRRLYSRNLYWPYLDHLVLEQMNKRITCLSSPPPHAFSNSASPEDLISCKLLPNPWSFWYLEDTSMVCSYWEKQGLWGIQSEPRLIQDFGRTLFTYKSRNILGF